MTANPATSPASGERAAQAAAPPPRCERVPQIAIIIPALDEERSLPLVLGALPEGLAAMAIVVDNGSRDRTAEVARAAGARVIREERRGYGAACLAGIAALPAGAEIVVFLDADWSDHPEQLPEVIAPIVEGRADFVIGSRRNAGCEPGAMLPQAVFGNRLAVFLMRVLLGCRYTDLGPFRAIRAGALRSLGMVDRDFGWTVEMQIKAARRGLRIAEVPVRYRRRVGHSKITGTLAGTLRAGYKILATIFRYGVLQRNGAAPARGRGG
ncbi:MAG: glycosyltransferase family 2 protein [Planctomycetes bacterium]|nr:glycosyltransferase family 2 protein [Planctomycetota bacterium]